jgi:hypothetical protein
MPCEVLKVKSLNPNTMKNGLPMNPMLFKAIVLVTCFMLVMLYNKSKAADLRQPITHVVAIP